MFLLSNEGVDRFCLGCFEIYCLGMFLWCLCAGSVIEDAVKNLVEQLKITLIHSGWVEYVKKYAKNCANHGDTKTKSK